MSAPKMTATDAFLSSYCAIHGVDPARFGCAQPREGERESGTVDTVAAVAAVAVDHLFRRATQAMLRGERSGQLTAQPPLEQWHARWEDSSADEPGLVMLELEYRGRLSPEARRFAIRHLTQLGHAPEQAIVQRMYGVEVAYTLVVWLVVRETPKAVTA